MVVQAHEAYEIVMRIKNVLDTTPVGPGKIFVSDIEDVLHTRTGERGHGAVAGTVHLDSLTLVPLAHGGDIEVAQCAAALAGGRRTVTGRDAGVMRCATRRPGRPSRI